MHAVELMLKMTSHYSYAGPQTNPPLLHCALDIYVISMRVYNTGHIVALCVSLKQL